MARDWARRRPSLLSRQNEVGRLADSDHRRLRALVDARSGPFAGPGRPPEPDAGSDHRGGRLRQRTAGRRWWPTGAYRDGHLSAVRRAGDADRLLLRTVRLQLPVLAEIRDESG